MDVGWERSATSKLLHPPRPKLRKDRVERKDWWVAGKKTGENGGLRDGSENARVTREGGREGVRGRERDERERVR